MERWIVGVDIGGTTTKLAFVHPAGEILHKWEIATDIAHEGKNITKNIISSIENKLEELNETKSRLSGLGVGAPGSFDAKAGRILEAVNLGWKDVPLQTDLEQALSLPVKIDNDANCAALGERWLGAGKDVKDLVCVTLGTGVGGGVITNGKIVHGISGAAGELGHITVIPHHGATCNCGKTGCLETIASASGIVRMALEAIARNENNGELTKKFHETRSISAKDVFLFAAKGDLLASSIVSEATFHLGFALANIGSSLNPEKIVLGGGVANAGNQLLLPVRQYFKKYAFPTVARSTEIVLAKLGNDAGVVGAASLMKDMVN